MDNRIRFSAARIDFPADVGTTGQDHDNYPAPSGQARYDHMRSVIIGLLAQQSSETAPTQFREGTPWYDLSTKTLKIRKDNAWVPYAEVLALTEPDSDGAVVTLAQWYNAVSATLASLAPEIVFSGSCTVDGITTITIPGSVQSQLAIDSRVFLTLNGLAIAPQNCSLLGTPPTTIKLSGVVLSAGDIFTVSIRRIDSSTFITAPITVP